MRKESPENAAPKIRKKSIQKRIKALYNNDANATKVLVRNEIGRVQAEVNEVWAKEYNIEWQLFDATLDGKTSSMCQGYDGKVYRVDDSSKPVPNVSTHICCRSCLIALPDKDYRPRTKIDNKTKEQIKYKTYEEWKASK